MVNGQWSMPFGRKYLRRHCAYSPVIMLRLYMLTMPNRKEKDAASTSTNILQLQNEPRQLSANILQLQNESR
jgi:hypothetical protein